VVSKRKAHCLECRFEGSATQFVVPGIVDGAKALSKHEFRKRHNISTVLHWHGKSTSCNDKCEVWYPQEGEA
jgi:hypothetical protein